MLAPMSVGHKYCVTFTDDYWYFTSSPTSTVYIVWTKDNVLISYNTFAVSTVSLRPNNTAFASNA